MSWAAVIPSNRPERLSTFVCAWEELFQKHDVEVIVVRDEPPWEGVPDFIPRRTDMIRSWGFAQAYRTDADFVVSLDDDVLPGCFDLFEEYERGFARSFPLAPYLSVGALTTSELEMRGFPYENRSAPVGIQYGGWHGVLDYDAVMQIAHRPGDELFHPIMMPVPRGCAVTTCAMNFAFRRDLTPLAWQLPLLEGRYNRMGDIWSGLFQKQALDAADQVMLVNGRASVVHERASDPWQNLNREAPGMALNEDLWNALNLALTDVVAGLDPLVSWRLVVQAAADFFDHRGDVAYADYFRANVEAWLDLF